MRNRFKKGHPYYPPKDGKKAGRPPRAREEAYMEALVESMPLADFLKVCRVHAARAQAGDLPTFRTFLDRLLGKTRESPEREALSESLRGLLLSWQDACDSGEADGETNPGDKRDAAGGDS